MAHASRIEKAKLTIKKAKKAKRKQLLKLNSMEEDERNELLEKRNAPLTDDERIARMSWDFNQNSLSNSKLRELLELLNKKSDDKSVTLRAEVQRRIEKNVSEQK